MINFAKAHAYGNDFLYAAREDVSSTTDPSALAVEMCDRHTGVGADGLIVYMSRGEFTQMMLWNADGSPSEISGNGIRGLAALLLDSDSTIDRDISISTGAGMKHLRRVSRTGSRQLFRSAMGRPFGLERTSIAIDGESIETIVLNVGNPQCIVLGPLPDDTRFNRLGPLIEHHSMFPQRTNVEFVHVEAPDRLRIRIWERGAGPTQSSGTGSCASLVAAAAFGGAARDADVVAPGGTQRVEWRDEGVYLTGRAEVVCRGEWLPQFPRTC